jgi:hypothetical protein
MPASMHRPSFALSRALALVAAVAACAGCRGAVSSPPPSAAIAPVRIVLGWAGDPATSQAVTWRTTAAVAAPQAQIGLAAPGCAGPTGPVRVVTAAARPIQFDDGRRVTYYRADFFGLAPATAYAYRVGSGSAFSYWHCFATAAAGPAPFRFIYLGDAQNGLAKKWPRVVRAALAAAPDARFLVHAGDLVNDGYDDLSWGEWLSGLGAAAEKPNVPVPGNHDLILSPAMAAFGGLFAAPALWTAQFALPANGPADLPELAGQNYYLDYQGARIVALDVNAFADEDYTPSQRARVQAAQVKWLREVLGGGPRRWTIVVQHQPIYSVVKGRDYARMRTVLGALYDEYGVDLVLQGHDHAYARTHKVRGGRLADPQAPGTIYVISVSGSKMYGITSGRDPRMARLREGSQLFQVVAVSGNRMSFESREADGTRIDGFELVKTSGSASSYVNLAPGAADGGRQAPRDASGSGPAR